MDNHPKGIKGEPHEEKMVQDYVSTLYSKRYSGTGFLYHARIITDMLDGLKFRDGRYSDKILDVGCGIGFVSQLYPNFDIVGIDISDGMLEKNPYKWIKAPVEEIPFPDNEFDFVICRSLLHHLDDPRLGLKEMFRVLKPSGKWICWDPNHTGLNALFRKIFQHTSRFSHLHKSFNDRKLIQLIKDAGFSIIDVKYIGFLGYPFLGFPDILDFRIPIWLGRKLMSIDNFISKTPFRRLSWSLMIRGVKS